MVREEEGGLDSDTIIDSAGHGGLPTSSTPHSTHILNKPSTFAMPFLANTRHLWKTIDYLNKLDKLDKTLRGSHQPLRGSSGLLGGPQGI